jgi:hypothetical protein
MTSTMPHHLARLGDELERAVGNQITGSLIVRRTRRMRSRGTMAAAIAGTVVLLGAGAAAAVALLTPHDVAVGLPAGSVVFAGVTPTCTAVGKAGDTMNCTIDGGMKDTSLADWTGTIENFTGPDSTIGGACRSQDARGAEWLCFTGQKAVDEKLIGPAVLGLHSNGPAAG